MKWFVLAPLKCVRLQVRDLSGGRSDEVVRNMTCTRSSKVFPEDQEGMAAFTNSMSSYFGELGRGRRTIGECFPATLGNYL